VSLTTLRAVCRRTAANGKGCAAAGQDDVVDDDAVQAGARVTWTPQIGKEYYLQVTGDDVAEFGSFSMTLTSPSSFSVEEVAGE
jgi:hypothetical protein